MPNKITVSDSCSYSIYYSNKDRYSASLFLFYFFISVIMALGRMVAKKFYGLT